MKTRHGERRPGARQRLPARPVASLALALLLSTLSVVFHPLLVEAHAAAIAVAESAQPLRETPSLESEVRSELPVGTEMELTGRASGDFVEVIADGITGWVDVNAINAGQIETATTNTQTPITTEPSGDGQILAFVPAGDTVILTGAAVDAFRAGSYNGTGGWLPAANLE